MEMTHQPSLPRSNPPRKRNPWKEGGLLSAGVLVVIAIYAMANYLSMRYYHRVDATASKLYTLSEKSKNVVRGLDRNVDLVVLLDPGSEVYVATDELIDRYVAANPQRMTRRDLDAATNRLEVQALIDRYGLDRDNVLVVASQDDKRVIGGFELADVDYSGAQYGQPPAIEEFKGEQMITSAILSLVEEQKPKLVFTTGHGEATLDAGDPRALSQAKDLLGKENFDIQDWSSLGAEQVPGGTDLLVVAGPSTRLLDSEFELFSNYLESGGRILLFLDPIFAANQDVLLDTGFSPWLSRYGIDARRDIVIDPSSKLPVFGPETLFTDHYGEHPIVQSLAQTRTQVLLPMVSSVSAMAEATDADVTELVLTSPDAWGETDFEDLENLAASDDEVRGTVSIAVAATLPAAVPLDASTPDDPVSDDLQAGRMVVFGDLDFATDAQLGNSGNALLLLNAFNWLVEREELIDIEARTPEKTRLALSSGELGSLYTIVMLLLPGVAIIAGVWIAMRRRR